MRVASLTAHDVRLPLDLHAGSDARHPDPAYSFATCILRSDTGIEGTGIALTLGRGNELVTQAITCFEDMVTGIDVDAAVAELGRCFNEWSNEGQLRWVGPHKGVIHLALAAVVGAVVDLWAKRRGAPLWSLLLDLSPADVAALVDFSTIDDYLSPDEAISLLDRGRLPAADIDALLSQGYPAYDTSVGWLGYSDGELRDNVATSVEAGFGAVKIKVGSDRLGDDIRRLELVRGTVGSHALMMIDANQRWGVAGAVEAGKAFAPCDPFWFEEPIHPDDVLGYRDVVDALAPMRIAGGEHLSNQVLFKNFLRAGSLQVVQPDAVRLGGLPEYLAVALMSAKAGLPALPHVGDMGQLHQHLILFTRAALGMPELPLEMIPHVRQHFEHPFAIADGRYVVPGAPGAGTTLRADSIERWSRR